MLSKASRIYDIYMKWSYIQYHKIKDYVSALTSAHLFCQDNDLREVDQDFRYLLSNNSQQTGLRIRLDDDVGKKIINEFYVEYDCKIGLA